MTAEQKIYWLKGYLEGKDNLTKDQIDTILLKLTLNDYWIYPYPNTYPGIMYNDPMKYTTPYGDLTFGTCKDNGR